MSEMSKNEFQKQDSMWMPLSLDTDTFMSEMSKTEYQKQKQNSMWMPLSPDTDTFMSKLWKNRFQEQDVDGIGFENIDNTKIYNFQERI